jgi:Chaperone of endosialidase
MLDKASDNENLANFESITVGNEENITTITGSRIKHNKQLLFQQRSPGNSNKLEVYVDGNLGAASFLYCNKNIASLEGDITALKGVIQANDVLINSSQELKQDISTLTKEEAYEVIKNLEPMKFFFKDDPSKKQNIGFIAEQVPDIVSSEDHKQVRYMEIISALTKVVKEQQKELDKLKQEIQELK